LGAIFSVVKELRMAKPWEEVELAVWGELKYYKSVLKGLYVPHVFESRSCAY
jgi:hypothetical protein